MMKTIPVKIGWEVLGFVLLVLIFSNYKAIIKLNWNVILFSGIIFGLVLALSFSIKYRLDNENLYIKNSIFGTTKIRVNEITKIEKTWNIISSPAPSVFGRVEVYYENKSIVISPKNFDEFADDLLKINPNIIIKK